MALFEQQCSLLNGLIFAALMFLNTFRMITFNRVKKKRALNTEHYSLQFWRFLA